jgi:protein-S-isoprenylcysteine O-methyltransferase Ste14
MFALTGAILAVYGMASDKAIYQRSLGINVNLWWGLVMVVFAAVMLLLAWRAHGKARPEPGPDGGPAAGPPGH